LKPTNVVEVREAFHDSVDEIEFGSGLEEMAEDVQLGNNVQMLDVRLQHLRTTRFYYVTRVYT
jgi:hypothetical protein